MNIYTLYWLDDTTDLYFFSVFSKKKEAYAYEKKLKDAFPKMSVELKVSEDIHESLEFLLDLREMGSIDFAKEKIDGYIDDHWGTVEKIIEYKNKYVPHRGKEKRAG